MFCGIDPEGLLHLAGAVAGTTDSARSRVRPGQAILDKHGFSAASALLGAGLDRLAGWGDDSAATLRWRAEAIRYGQHAGLDTIAVARRRFAAEALFSLGTLDKSLRAWIREWKQSRARTAIAIEQITDWLSEGWTTADWDVTNNDLHNIQGKLETLSAAELDRVLMALSPDLLKRWIAEMGHSINGFSLEEQSALFDLLAANASGEGLARIHDALAAVGGEPETIALGTSIRDHSAEEVIVDFVAAVVRSDLSRYRYSGLAPAIAIGALRTDEPATRLSRVLAQHEGSLELLLADLAVSDAAPSRSAPELADALSLATDREAAGVLFASLVRSSSNHDELVAGRGEPALATSNARATEMKHARHAEALQDDLLATATRLIEADANAVIEQLATKLDRDGALTATYWYLLAEEGAGGTIGGILDNLRGGETVDLDRFCDAGAKPDYVNSHAQNLAFAAATLNRAFTTQAENAKEDVDAIARLSNVLVSVVGLTSGASGVTEGVIGTATDWSLSAHADGEKDDIDESLAMLIDTIRLRLLPDHPQVEPLGYGTATRAWLDVYGGLLPFA